MDFRFSLFSEAELLFSWKEVKVYGYGLLVILLFVILLCSGLGNQYRMHMNRILVLLENLQETACAEVRLQAQAERPYNENHYISGTFF